MNLSRGLIFGLQFFVPRQLVETGTLNIEPGLAFASERETYRRGQDKAKSRGSLREGRTELVIRGGSSAHLKAPKHRCQHDDVPCTGDGCRWSALAMCFRTPCARRCSLFVAYVFRVFPCSLGGVAAPGAAGRSFQRVPCAASARREPPGGPRGGERAFAPGAVPRAPLPARSAAAQVTREAQAVLPSGERGQERL